MPLLVVKLHMWLNKTAAIHCASFSIAGVLVLERKIIFASMKALHGGERFMHVAANEIQAMNESSEPFLEYLCIEKATATFFVPVVSAAWMAVEQWCTSLDTRISLTRFIAQSAAFASLTLYSVEIVVWRSPKHLKTPASLSFLECSNGSLKHCLPHEHRRETA